MKFLLTVALLAHVVTAAYATTPELETSIDTDIETSASRSGKLFYVTTTTTYFKYTSIFTQLLASFRTCWTTIPQAPLTLMLPCVSTTLGSVITPTSTATAAAGRRKRSEALVESDPFQGNNEELVKYIMASRVGEKVEDSSLNTELESFVYQEEKRNPRLITVLATDIRSTVTTVTLTTTPIQPIRLVFTQQSANDCLPTDIVELIQPC